MRVNGHEERANVVLIKLGQDSVTRPSWVSTMGLWRCHRSEDAAKYFLDRFTSVFAFS